MIEYFKENKDVVFEKDDIAQNNKNLSASESSITEEDDSLCEDYTYFYNQVRELNVDMAHLSDDELDALLTKKKKHISYIPLSKMKKYNIPDLQADGNIIINRRKIYFKNSERLFITESKDFPVYTKPSGTEIGVVPIGKDHSVSIRVSLDAYLIKILVLISIICSIVSIIL